MQDKIDKIVASLKAKACLKQRIYRSSLEVFQQMKTHAQQISEYLNTQFEETDPSVHIEFSDVGEFEFHIKFSGDLLVFSMHTNVIAFPGEHLINKSPYTQADPDRAFFSQILIYNFMADSVKYNRLNDAGYLIARIALNNERHFYIEGARQLNFLYPDIAQNEISPQVIRLIIEDSMLLAIDTDLTATNFQEIQFITLGQKQANQMQPAAEKVGFTISAQTN